MVKVFVTIDTEVWPNAKGWPHTPLEPDRDCAREIDLYLYGGEHGNAMGLPYQLATLEHYGLRATFFVDPLFSFALGIAPLEKLVAKIVSAKQELALHLHPEWLTDPRCGGMPRFAGPFVREYAIADQRVLVREGWRRLREAGAQRVCAFRAGNWGADRATLAALADEGIPFDTSLNATFAASFPEIEPTSRGRYTQPFRIGTTWEFPVTNFVDRPPAGLRPMHVCASSFSEMRTVLEHARENAWYCVVLVLHCFEFVRVNGGELARPHRLLADRFERLCAYLSAHDDAFETVHFVDLDPETIPEVAPRAMPVSSGIRTALRRIQQLASRVY